MNRKLVGAVALIAIFAVGIGGGALAAVVVGLGDDDDAAQSVDEPDGPAGPVPAGLGRFYEQRLDWQPDCHRGTECATLTVPVDYREPDGATVDLALERRLADDQSDKVGSLVVNPGGPGFGGTIMAEIATGFFRPELLERVDIVAFDPRGTGDSDPLDCVSDQDLDTYLGQDPTPDDDAEVAEVAANQEAFFAGCVASSDELVGHVSTAETARDMDVLRGVLAEEELDYLGFSYGTTLGSTYAQLFPGNVGRFVLDGATDPSLDLKSDLLSQAEGFQTALDAYVDACVAGGDCFLGGDRTGALVTIDDLLATIDATPLPVDDGRELQAGNAFYALAAPLYSEQRWPELDRAIGDALDGDGTSMMQLFDGYWSRGPSGYTDNVAEAISAINCLDDPSFVEPADIPATYPEFDAASPTFGRVFAWSQLGCRGLQVEPAEVVPPIRAEGAAPIVVVGTTRDPATPYQEAVALAEQLESGVLLSRDGDGHTAYNSGNTCIDEAIEGYLLDGVVPADGTEC
ncbi:alpha/beta hydrolase [Nocardioides sp. C4-1]|uniref:alpha/beta hydrolase n=1 Tax=Nocardioides sp. C4-1 TaxID=3151851 RepID=UPI003263574B